MTNVDITTILDGAFDVPMTGHVRWGAVVVSKETTREVSKLSLFGRSTHVRSTVALPLDLTIDDQPMVFRNPRLFAASVVAILAPASGVGFLPLREQLGGAIASRQATFVEASDGRAWLGDVRGTLHDRFDQSVRMRDIARLIGIHPVHLSHRFADHYGITMTRYLRDLRVMRACELLLSTAHTLSRIALTTGFADHAHFTRAFTSTLGIAPSAFRRRVGARAAA